MVETVTRMTVEQELGIIQSLHGGTIPPEAVVEYAKNPETALHSRFLWDDSRAAYGYRLWQARQILRVYVTMEMPDRSSVTVRAYVSLPEDRKSGEGYRSVAHVLQNEALKTQMLKMAAAELRTFRKKYESLKELSEVHASIDKVLSVI